ncbi:hypothetical protein CEUSTIGMA_g639.t1 [Chlamydomonas eustigma]|uniref:3'-phosphate/5'-hydroxy nucleic acid ligase n=1 Tax=Chlamydomonas eustigma TaxID=1157962 RepID=A0A250WR63_9CHLO|nr:hypothetical protein CEUSTIGMA_g639.t1 [Chlamydomonas eustigma]|eukprot:GAX73186.1 hypothetical protein CEUSTIGMA_g639.t1 [Chlamydomonas eustigma]
MSLFQITCRCSDCPPEAGAACWMSPACFEAHSGAQVCHKWKLSLFHATEGCNMGQWLRDRAPALRKGSDGTSCKALFESGEKIPDEHNASYREMTRPSRNHTNSSNFAYENQALYERPLLENQPQEVHVMCRCFAGVLSLLTWQVTCSCESCGGNVSMTPQGFESHCGATLSKKWKHSIKCAADGRTIESWLVARGITPPGTRMKHVDSSPSHASPVHLLQNMKKSVEHSLGMVKSFQLCPRGVFQVPKGLWQIPQQKWPSKDHIETAMTPRKEGGIQKPKNPKQGQDSTTVGSDKKRSKWKAGHVMCLISSLFGRESSQDAARGLMQALNALDGSFTHLQAQPTPSSWNVLHPKQYKVGHGELAEELDLLEVPTSPRGPGNLEAKLSEIMPRVEVIHNGDRRVAVVSELRAEDAIRAACNKFRLNHKNFDIYFYGVVKQSDDLLEDCSSVWSRVEILDGQDVWIDPEAVDQVHNTVSNANGDILKAVGLPDLHQGPTGVAILARHPMPKLPGCDIGCGMALFLTNIPSSMSRDRVARCMARMDLDSGEDPHDPHFGTIGGGNHFAELLIIDPQTPMSEELQPLLPPDTALLLVHSGSRGHGSRVYQKHVGGHDLPGYMTEHKELVVWAAKNRAEIARRFLTQFSATYIEPSPLVPNMDVGVATTALLSSQSQEACSHSDKVIVKNEFKPGAPETLVDIAHNWIQEMPDGTYLHRKGAAPSFKGSLSLLPGSRATASYVLVCDGEMERDLCSVAHGAGRRLSRADARKHLQAGSTASAARDRVSAPVDLTRGGTVICESKELLLEEAPHAYKDVEAVVSCMVKRSMCRVGARLLPIATYKTRRTTSGS